MKTRLALLPVLVVLACPPAAAQPAPSIPNSQSIGVGPQWAPPYSPGGTPGVQATWRRWFSPHVGIGADVRWGRRTTTEEFDSPAQVSAYGAIVPAARGRDEQRTSSTAVGFAILARAPVERLSFVVGGGPAMFFTRWTHDTRIGDRQRSGSHEHHSFGLQMIMEIDARLTNRLYVFAGLRTELRDTRSVDSSVGYPTAGVRVAF